MFFHDRTRFPFEGHRVLETFGSINPLSFQKAKKILKSECRRWSPGGKNRKGVERFQPLDMALSLNSILATALRPSSLFSFSLILPSTNWSS